MNTLVICNTHGDIHRKLHEIVNPNVIIRYSEGITECGNQRCIYVTPDQYNKIMGIEINALIINENVIIPKELETYLKSHIRTI